MMWMFSQKHIFTNNNTNTITVRNTKSMLMENVQCAQQQTFSLSLIPNKIQFRVQFSSQIGNECWTFLTCNVCLSNAPSISSQQHPTVLERVRKMISKINSIYTPRFFGSSSSNTVSLIYIFLTLFLGPLGSQEEGQPFILRVFPDCLRS